MRRNRLGWVGAGAIAAAATTMPAYAGAVYGTLTRNGAPLAGAQVILTCGSLISSGQAGPKGQYRLTIAGGGRCSLTIDGRSADIALGDQPLRQDFEVPAGTAPLAPR
ncbi:MAG: hypothetical protein J0L57_09315 [Burkholderiales bacterium]|nr:hypothetical protein [Burkholderiales bacterium]